MEYGQRQVTATVASSASPSSGIRYLLYVADPTLTGSRVLESAGSPIALSDTGSAIQINVDISALTADASPDGAADYVMTYDASAGAHKKVLLDDLPGGGGGSGATVGTAELDFGSFPGASDASVAVTGQAGILSGSVVQAWILPAATTDHSADEHLVEPLRVMAGNIVAGDGFTIYGVNENQLSEPIDPVTMGLSRATALLGPGIQDRQEQRSLGGTGTRLYGKFTVAWRWE